MTGFDSSKTEQDLFLGCRVLCRDVKDYCWLPGGEESDIEMWRHGSVRALSPKLKVQAGGFDRAMDWDQVLFKGKWYVEQGAKLA